MWIDNLAPVVIGHNVCLSQGSYLCTGNHDFRKPSFDLKLAAISIGSQSWIAANAVLAPGTCIGTGSVICLGSIVSGQIAPRSIVRGNPATVVGQR